MSDIENAVANDDDNPVNDDPAGVGGNVSEAEAPTSGEAVPAGGEQEVQATDDDDRVPGVEVTPDTVDELLEEEPSEDEVDAEAASPEEGSKPKEEPQAEPSKEEPPAVDGEKPPAQAAPKEGEKPAETPSETPAETPASEGEEVVPLTMEQIQENYAKGKAETVKILAEGAFKLTDEEAAELETDAPAVVSRLMARTYTDAVTGAVSHMITNLPSLVNAVIQGRAVADKDVNEFFSAWPKLKGAEADVERVGRAYRQVNPQATKEQFIKEVGVQVMVMKKIPFDAVEGAAPVEQEAPQAPFVPAAGGGKPAGGGQPVRSDNQFAQFAEELEEDDNRDG